MYKFILKFDKVIVFYSNVGIFAILKNKPFIYVISYKKHY